MASPRRMYLLFCTYSLVNASKCDLSGMREKAAAISQNTGSVLKLRFQFSMIRLLLASRIGLWMGRSAGGHWG